MKVIIIGSKGFIGRHLFEYLECNGHEVWGADVIVDYIHTEHYYLIDASNADFSSIFKYINYDVCINCSGASSVPDSIINPLRDYYLNTLNVFKLLEAIRNFQSNCGFINLSSAAVYGNPKDLPIKETANTNPLSPYGIHKHQADQICKEFHDFYKLRTCTLRIFSVYGIGLQKQLFWDLFKKAKEGIPFTLFGTGDESRDFIYISDLVRAIEIVAQSTTYEADIINIANGNEIKIRDAVSIFFSHFKVSINYTFSGEIREGDPANWRADISKLTSLGYAPMVNIKTGLKEYYEWLNK